MPLIIPQQTQNIRITFAQRRPNVQMVYTFFVFAARALVPRAISPTGHIRPETGHRSYGPLVLRVIGPTCTCL